MKKIAIILVIVAIILGLYEQTKEKPNVIIEAVCIVVVMIAMMRLSSKTPSKNNEDDV
jgi:L-asparagine transporter-like permease